LTTLTLAGHKTLLGLLQRYLAWRGCKNGKCLLLLGASGRRADVTRTLAQALAIARSGRGVHIGRALGEKWKQNRFRSVYLRNALWQNGYAVDTAETAVDWPRVGAMMQAIEQAASSALAADGERLHTYTHLSHLYAQGASVYSTFVWRLAGDYDADLARWRALKAAVCEAVVVNRGSISHQHGVGTDHAPYLAAEKGELGIGAMRALFRHFDPQGMMNPGKLLPPGS
ncbi:MAG: FAD-linked oxidase C-terminal domain-containing protein, partial [Burkholderiales bacterium]